MSAGGIRTCVLCAWLASVAGCAGQVASEAGADAATTAADAGADACPVWMGAPGDGATTCKDTVYCQTACLPDAAAADDPCLRTCAARACAGGWTQLETVWDCAGGACPGCTAGKPSLECLQCITSSCFSQFESCARSTCD